MKFVGKLYRDKLKVNTWFKYGNVPRIEPFRNLSFSRNSKKMSQENISEIIQCQIRRTMMEFVSILFLFAGFFATLIAALNMAFTQEIFLYFVYLEHCIWNLKLNSSYCRALKIITIDTKTERISREMKIENSISKFCVGVWVGGHLPTNFSYY